MERERASEGERASESESESERESERERQDLVPRHVGDEEDDDHRLQEPWSNRGQTVVKPLSSRSNRGQTVVKLWSNRGQTMVKP